MILSVFCCSWTSFSSLNFLHHFLISAWCHQYGPDSGLLTADFHRGDGLAVTNINDDQQNFGCVNDDCFPSDRDRYVIAQLASGNTNNSVIPSLRIHNWSLGYAQHLRNRLKINLVVMLHYSYYIWKDLPLFIQ